jgi:hypothetical protein
MDAVYGQASDNKVGGAPKVVERKQQEKVPEKGWNFRQVSQGFGTYKGQAITLFYSRSLKHIIVS